VKCEVAQQALSEAMDQALPLTDDTQSHIDGCYRCQTFARGVWRIRELTRIELAPPVPDLVSSIMGRVADEAADRLLGWAPTSRRRVVGSWLVRQRAVAMALVAGLVIGVVVTVGGVIPSHRVDTEALASEIPRDLIRAATSLKGYQATFALTELGWTSEVSRRTFTAEVAFIAPERFRVQVTDTTTYPSEGWPRNDLLLVTDGRRWRAIGPDPCPAGALPSCPSSESVEQATVNRAPFDSETASPTDVIVPMTVLAAQDRVSVLGPDRVGGRNSIAVQLTYQDASPLLDYLRFLGSWRPFFPQDRVVLWLDRGTWFPLQYQVFPAAGDERSLWAAQMGLPNEPPQAAIFTATATSLSTEPPTDSLFDFKASRNATDERFDDLGISALSSAGSKIVQPAVTEGLEPYRYGSFARTELRPYDHAVAAYAGGLGWLTVTRVAGWDQPALFGVGPFAEEISLSANRGVAFYVPATARDPRRLAIHTERAEYLLATNLPRASLLQIAASMPLTGLRPPGRWLVHNWPGGVVRNGLDPTQAIARSKFPVLVPTVLPGGYSAAVAQTLEGRGTRGITIVYRRPGAELDGVGLLLYQATGQTLPPPTSAADQVVTVRGVAGRWSPEEHLLEWMESDVYRSLFGPAFGLQDLLGVAAVLEAP